MREQRIDLANKSVLMQRVELSKKIGMNYTHSNALRISIIYDHYLGEDLL